MNTLTRLFLGSTLVATATACSNDRVSGPTRHSPVRYDLVLNSPNEAEAGVLLRFTGKVDSITASRRSVDVIPVERIRTDTMVTTRIVLVGPLNSGIIATVWTDESAGQLTAHLEQVSAAGTLVQRTLAGYSLALVRRSTPLLGSI